MNDQENFERWMQVARKALAEHDPSLAVYVLRDLPEVQAHGLDALAWVFVQHGVTQSEAARFVELVDEMARRGETCDG